MQATDSRLVLSPSDLNDYVECAHLTTLALEVARGVRQRPHVPDDHGDLLRRKGEEHEANYLAELRKQGCEVVNVLPADPWNFATSACTSAGRPLAPVPSMKKLSDMSPGLIFLKFMRLPVVPAPFAASYSTS